MKFIKKTLSLVLIGLLAIILIACDRSQITTNTTVNTTSQTTEITTEITSTTTSSLLTTESTSAFTNTTESIIKKVSIELIENTQPFYYINEEFNPSSISLLVEYSDGSKEPVNPEEISVRSFNTSTSGKKNIFIIYDKFLIETTITVLEEYAFPIYMEYYRAALNLRGDILKVTLNNIIHDGFVNLLYIDAITVLENSDKDPNNSKNVMLVYPGIYGESVPTGYSSSIGGYYWNREHVWPQSRLGVYVVYGDGDFPSKATDMHNLKPADPDENSARSNDYFDWIKTNDTYEPRDEVKGDIARILFYMATMYFDLTLNDNPLTSPGYYTMGILSVLLEWNRLDPVDDFERNRNEVIYSYQGNRNPYIDYPEFADLIWGDLAS
jgi:hypothetical protein